MTNNTTTFRQNLTSFINIVFFKSDTFIPTPLTFRYHFCGSIDLWPQNTLQFRQSLLHWSQISFPGVFFLGLQTGSSRWEPNPENTMVGVAIQSTIRAILPLLLSTCDTMYCLGERALFSSSFGVVFRNFFLRTHQ